MLARNRKHNALKDELGSCLDFKCQQIVFMPVSKTAYCQSSGGTTEEVDGFVWPSWQAFA